MVGVPKQAWLQGVELAITASPAYAGTQCSGNQILENQRVWILGKGQPEVMESLSFESTHVYIGYDHGALAFWTEPTLHVRLLDERICDWRRGTVAWLGTSPTDIPIILNVSSTGLADPHGYLYEDVFKLI